MRRFWDCQRRRLTLLPSHSDTCRLDVNHFATGVAHAIAVLIQKHSSSTDGHTGRRELIPSDFLLSSPVHHSSDYRLLGAGLFRRELLSFWDNGELSGVHLTKMEECPSFAAIFVTECGIHISYA
jgi:hypothetical protein